MLKAPMLKDPLFVVDVDGTLAKFVEAALALHGRRDLIDSLTGWVFKPDSSGSTWPAGEYSLEKILGLTTEEFWVPINNEGADFWANLQPTRWMHHLLHILPREQTFIATSPSHDPECAAGKVRWLDKYLGHGKPFRRFVITPKKHMLAATNRILIDDSDEQIQRWRDMGGQAITYPQPWNHNYRFATNPIDRVRWMLRQMRAV